MFLRLVLLVSIGTGGRRKGNGEAVEGERDRGSTCVGIQANDALPKGRPQGVFHSPEGDGGAVTQYTGERSEVTGREGWGCPTLFSPLTFSGTLATYLLESN